METTVRIIVCDDEITAVQRVVKELKHFFHNANIETVFFSCTSAFQIFEIMDKQEITVFFLDIDMPERNGIDLAEEIKKKSPEALLIFVSGREEFVFESFRVHPFSFVRKMFLESDLCKVVREIKEVIRERENYRRIIITDETGYEFVTDVNKVLYLEAKDKYVQVFTENGERLIRSSLKEQQKKLEQINFRRCHKSFLVNMRKVYAVRCDRVILVNRKELPLGRGKATELKRELSRYLLE